MDQRNQEKVTFFSVIGGKDATPWPINKHDYILGFES